jgi:hypothetical protein
MNYDDRQIFCLKDFFIILKNSNKVFKNNCLVKKLRKLEDIQSKCLFEKIMKEKKQMFIHVYNSFLLYDTIKYNCENLYGNKIISASGWAFNNKIKSKNSVVCLVLVSHDGNEAFILNTSLNIRLDVGGYFKDDDRNFSGFSVVGFTNNLSKGNFSLRLGVYENRNKIYVDPRPLKSITLN